MIEAARPSKELPY